MSDLARLIHTLGYLAQHKGDQARAKRQFLESLAMYRRLGNRRGMAECLAGLAGLRAQQGHPQWAAETVRQATGGAWWPADRVEVERHPEIIRSALDEARPGQPRFGPAIETPHRGLFGPVDRRPGRADDLEQSSAR